ncbi:MAG: hypothetical protein O2904_01590 [bacterium]|nr:hypothetical protein [bacterium]
MVSRFLVIGTITLFLTACGGDGGSTSCTQDYWDGERFGTCIPDDWAVIDTETLRQRGVSEDTLVAFQSDIPVAGQFPTVSLTWEPLAQVVKPADYSAANIRSVGVFPGYKQLDARDIRIDDESLRLHIFTAQPVSSEPLRRYYQVSTVVGSDGYTLTATTPLSLEDSLEDQILLILRNATFVVPEE